MYYFWTKLKTMKKVYMLFLLSFVSFVMFGGNDPVKSATKFSQKQSEVNDQLFKIQEIDRILKEEQITYSELAAKYPDLVNATNLAPTVDEGIFEKSADSPLGIPGFWWGFCLGVVGLIIVYVSMDEGADRKEQIKNALIGCVIAYGVFLLFYLVLWGVLFSTTVDASTTIPTMIAGSC